MNVYADSSALLKLVLREQGSDEMVALHAISDPLTCAAIGYVELRSGLAMAARMGRVDPPNYADHVLELQRLWLSLGEIPVDQQLLSRAGDHAEAHALRSFDAMHLAALAAAGPPGTITFACWDRDLREAAGSIGYGLLPEHA
jgi:uncharacterized protein